MTNRITSYKALEKQFLPKAKGAKQKERVSKGYAMRVESSGTPPESAPKAPVMRLRTTKARAKAPKAKGKARG